MTVAGGSRLVAWPVLSLDNPEPSQHGRRAGRQVSPVGRAHGRARRPLEANQRPTRAPQAAGGAPVAAAAPADRGGPAAALSAADQRDPLAGGRAAPGQADP